MSQSVWIIVAVIAVAVLAGAAILWSRRRRSEHLKDRFGREYDRTVDAKGDRAKAEALIEELHGGIDDLRLQKWAELLQIQQEQIALLQKVITRLESAATR